VEPEEETSESLLHMVIPLIPDTSFLLSVPPHLETFLFFSLNPALDWWTHERESKSRHFEKMAAIFISVI
jgi:hypothetical protein